MCRIISLIEQYFLLLITFYTYVLTCTNFKKYNYQTYFLLILVFLLLFTLGRKSVTRAPPGLLSSRMMSILAISSHKYTITLYIPRHLEIIWELFAKKSADILSFRNSFITISSPFIVTSATKFEHVKYGNTGYGVFKRGI